MSATSLNKIIDDFSIIMPDFIASNENFTFDLDLSNAYLYDLKINGIKFKKLDIKERSVKIIPGAKFPTIEVLIDKTDAVLHVTGGLEVGPFRMFNFTEMTLTGLKLQVELGII